MRESQLTEIAGASKLSLSFINRLIRRIETTKPIAGDNITITEQDDGYKVDAANAAPPIKQFNSATFTLGTFEVAEIEVCIGGGLEVLPVVVQRNGNSVTIMQTESGFPLSVLIR